MEKIQPGKDLFNLIPCPFCGAKPEPKMSAKKKGYIVKCPSCGIMVANPETEKPKYSKTLYDAVVEWNCNVTDLNICRKEAEE